MQCLARMWGSACRADEAVVGQGRMVARVQAGVTLLQLHRYLAPRGFECSFAPGARSHTEPCCCNAVAVPPCTCTEVSGWGPAQGLRTWKCLGRVQVLCVSLEEVPPALLHALPMSPPHVSACILPNLPAFSLLSATKTHHKHSFVSMKAVCMGLGAAEIGDATVGSLASGTSKDSSLDAPGYFSALVASLTYVNELGEARPEPVLQGSVETLPVCCKA